MKKSIILILMALVTLTAAAADGTPVKVLGLWYTFDDNGNTACVVRSPEADDISGDIVIPESVQYAGKDYNVTLIGDEAFCGASNIQSVTIGNNVMQIGRRAFAYSSVTSVIIGDGVKTIQPFAFYECKRLAYAQLGKEVNRINESAFHHCKSLTTLIMNGSNWGSMGRSVFFDCPKLTDVYCLMQYPLEGWDNNVFDRDRIGQMTVHVKEGNETIYQSYAPWYNFKEVKTITADELVKCATPKITYANGVVSFSCDTEGVEFRSAIQVDEAWFYDESKDSAPLSFTVSVFAVKPGCYRSDVVTDAFTLDGYTHTVISGDFKQGDVNKDGKVNVGDHVKLTDVILNK